MRVLFIIFFICINFLSYSQITLTPKNPQESSVTFLNRTDSSDVYTIVERMPSWNGCDQESEEKRVSCTYNKIMEFLALNVRYPSNAKNNFISGIVYVSFIINEFGQVVEPKVLRGVNEELDAEALRVVSLFPIWNPGTQKGKQVRVTYNLPVKFTLK